ncbi:MAG: ribulokinase, partial [SAR202 cluster bacterium]|nr:ribulokinase [SAR202 cluster bacterium]
AWQMLEEAPELYAQAERLVDAGDWLVWQLTGRLTRSACQAGYKALWSRAEGYPPSAFLTALDPRLARLPAEKLVGEVLPVGSRAGCLTPEMATRLGLQAGTAVATSIIDAHAAVPAAGVSAPGTLVVILGTSGCHLALGHEPRAFAGVAGVVEDGILPSYTGYEAGQPATGDILNWFVRQATSGSLEREAEVRGIAVHQLLSERAAGLRPGEAGLLALDWWNGNRSVLMDAELSGVLFGLTLDTRPEHMYRALIEGTAFGTRMILENLVRNGVPIQQIVGAGGLSERHALLMQIYADVCGRPIRVARSGQACAVGAAILGAVAAGSQAGGYGSIEEAVGRMGGVRERTYVPDPVAHSRYTEIYEEWVRLHDYLGRGANPVLKMLRGWRAA